MISIFGIPVVVLLFFLCKGFKGCDISTFLPWLDGKSDGNYVPPKNGDSKIVKVLILGRYNAGKSMMMRSLQGNYCVPSRKQTNGTEPVKPFECKINDKIFSFSQTVDISGNRVYYLAQGEKEGIIQDLLKDKDRIFFICDINEYNKNIFDRNIDKLVQSDVHERLVLIANVKPQNASLDVIFSHIDEIPNIQERERVKNKLITWMKGESLFLGGVGFYEVNFMNRESTENLISKLFK